MIDNLNLAIVGLLQDGAGCAALAKLRKLDGELITVAGTVGAEPWSTLGAILRDVLPVKADQVLIYGNAKLNFTRDWAPPSKDLWTRDAKGEPIPRRNLSHIALPLEARFVTLRLLCHFDKWRYVEVTPDALQSTARLLKVGSYTDERYIEI